MQQRLIAEASPQATTQDPDPVRLRFRYPVGGPAGECDNFFVGVWHPTRSLVVDWQGRGAAMPAVVNGRNWALASTVSPLHATGGGLIHATQDRASAIAFRGYVCEPALHSYSPGNALLRHWTSNFRGEHNGVFSTALITAQGSTLTLITDVLGFAPLYYRRLQGAVAFSTNPRLLATAGDTPDLLAWRCLLESGFIGSDRALSREIRRLPAGKSLQACGESLELMSWFDLEQLPRGDRPLDQQGIAEVERVFQEAMDRRLALADLQVLLPLSSGHDSRRMLASLIHRKADFHSLTSRVFHKGRDLDARYAAEMASDFGLSHTIIEPPSAQQFGQQDWTRRLLTDAESGMHSWVPGLMRALPQRAGMVFDGIAGDILGNPGFRIPGLYKSPQQDTDIVLGASLPNAFGRLLRAGVWPTAAQVKEDLRAYLQTLPQRINLAEFAFILLRQRRATAAWSQQLLPAGYVPVCPFLDLHYVRLLLSFVPQDKHATVLQRRCLADFWPQFSRYPGTRDIPPGTAQRSKSFDEDESIACLREMTAQIERGGWQDGLNSLLTGYGRLVLVGTRLSRQFTLRTQWQLQTLMELAARQATTTHCWSTEL